MVFYYVILGEFFEFISKIENFKGNWDDYYFYKCYWWVYYICNNDINFYIYLWVCVICNYNINFNWWVDIIGINKIFIFY